MTAPQGADPRLVAPGRGLSGAGLLRAVLVGCVVGLVFGSHPLAQWAEQLPEWAAPARTAASAWDGSMGRAGLSAPYAAVHRWASGLVGGSGESR